MATGDRKRRMTGSGYFDCGYMAETTIPLVLKAIEENDLSKAVVIIASQAGHHDNSESVRICFLAGEILSRFEEEDRAYALIAAQAMYQAAKDDSILADTLEKWHERYFRKEPVRLAPAPH